MPGYPVEVVNGLGAGDAFAAALGHSLLQGLTLAEARAPRHGRRRDRRVPARVLRGDAAPRRDRGGARMSELLLRDRTWDQVTPESAGWQLPLTSACAAGSFESETGDGEIALVLLCGRLPRRGRGRAAWSSAAARASSTGCRGRSTCRATPPTASRREARGRDLRRPLRDAARAGARSGRRTSRSRCAAPATRRGRSTTSSSRSSRPSGCSSSRCFTPSGNWSSYPPHKHDEDNAAGRGRARGDVLLPRPRRRRRSRVQRLYSPRARARRDGDRARRRPDARPVRLPHDRGGARLRPLLPERARGRPALDGRRRRSRRWRGSAAPGRGSSPIRACRSSRVIRVANAPRQLRRLRADGRRAPERARARTRCSTRSPRPGTRERSSARSATSATATSCVRGSRARGLALAGAFVEIRFGDGDLAELEATLDLFEAGAFGATGVRRRRLARAPRNPGRGKDDRRCGSTSRLERFADGLARAEAAAHAASRRRSTPHEHVRRAPAEIDRLLELLVDRPAAGHGAPARRRLRSRSARCATGARASATSTSRTCGSTSCARSSPRAWAASRRGGAASSASSAPATSTSTGSSRPCARRLRRLARRRAGPDPAADDESRSRPRRRSGTGGG